MSSVIDLTGQKFNCFTVIKRVEDRCNNKRWLCICDCGKEKIVYGGNLKNGHAKTCGCSHKGKANNFAHGLTKHPLYQVWMNMKLRCYDKNDKSYYRYGERGIKVSDEWINNFKSFYDWAMSKNWEKGLSIDRIENSGNYEPSNCRLATNKEQQRNTRRNVLITYNGITKCFSEWSEIFGIKKSTLFNRLNTRNWSIEKAFETPVKNEAAYNTF